MTQIEEVFLRIAVQKWLREYLQESHNDGCYDLTNMYGIGEVNTSLLAVEALENCGYLSEEDPDLVLDDETHWLHDEIIDAAEWWEQTKVVKNNDH